MTTQADHSSTQTSPMVVEGLETLRAAAGTRLGPTPWLRVDQARIDAFAEVTCDHQWIHVDQVRARTSSGRRSPTAI
ncbi:MaoC/PaaZ C-terminal domain-containing protein [Pseudonocardia ailaonensis]|uniref:MaoC/PaaZ C-terminal domain-containing protein n=1 Tax=Pseudonocardia ailaonensis TaxID=367279 RepID=UPI0031DC1B8F